MRGGPAYRTLGVGAGLAWLAVARAVLSTQAPRLGTIAFPTSGAPAAQAPFIQGVLLLHSFEYWGAAQAFREAERLDPGFALAYWGEALTYTHPLWNEQDGNAARAALQRLGPTAGARRARAPTPREKGYLDAVEALYGPGSRAQRDTAYSLAMQRLVERFPADQEAKVFYAVSLLGLHQGVRDVPTYLRAATIAETVFQKNPNHPGAAHVLLHCYDDPIHARLGLPAALAYSKIAPDAAHAQHMTTHIFVALGMWDEVVSQNEIASGPDRAAWTPHHYTHWLGYGYLEQGRVGDAGRLLELMYQNLARSRGHGRAVLAEMRADYVVNSEQWDCPCLRWGLDVSDARSRDRTVDAFVVGYGALQRGDRAAADRSLADIAAFNRLRAAADTAYERDPVPDIFERELRALLREAAGARQQAVVLMREGTALEDAMPLEAGPPPVVKPAHELLGEILLRAGQPREAEAEFARALQLTPRRALSLLGLGRAAALAGDQKAAATAYGELRQIWHQADRNLPGLAEAARFVAARP